MRKRAKTKTKTKQKNKESKKRVRSIVAPGVVRRIIVTVLVVDGIGGLGDIGGLGRGIVKVGLQDEPPDEGSLVLAVDGASDALIAGLAGGGREDATELLKLLP